MTAALISRHEPLRGRVTQASRGGETSLGSRGCPLRSLVGPRCSVASGTHPTNTATAITVVQSPPLSPTAVWVTFWVRTILLDSR